MLDRCTPFDKMASTLKNSRAAPSPTVVAVVRQYSSQLYYSWLERPATTSPARLDWDSRFTKTCKDLAKILAKHRFQELHPFIIGCVWEYNSHVRSGTTHVDAEAIQEASDGTHAAFNIASGRFLRYTPTRDGLGALLQRSEVSEVWWDVQGE